MIGEAEEVLAEAPLDEPLEHFNREIGRTDNGRAPTATSPERTTDKWIGPGVGHRRLAFHLDPDRPSKLDGEMASCIHLDHVHLTRLPESVEGCEECLAIGGRWLHLRICLECGRVGCCDDSPNRHARAHARSSGHPLIRSIEPGEEWSWCFVDDFALLVAGVQGQTRIPPSPLG